MHQELTCKEYMEEARKELERARWVGTLAVIPEDGTPERKRYKDISDSIFDMRDSLVYAVASLDAIGTSEGELRTLESHSIMLNEPHCRRMAAEKAQRASDMYDD